jgi:hypothetical protein
MVDNLLIRRGFAFPSQNLVLSFVSFRGFVCSSSVFSLIVYFCSSFSFLSFLYFVFFSSCSRRVYAAAHGGVGVAESVERALCVRLLSLENEACSFEENEELEALALVERGRGNVFELALMSEKEAMSCAMERIAEGGEGGRFVGLWAT